MAQKMDRQPAHPLPMSVEEKEKKKKQARRPAPPLPGAVTLVSLWALINACLPAFALALSFILQPYNVFSKMPSWIYHRIELTDAEGAMGSALELGHVWCGVPQAAAAALALLLAGRRRRVRRALAYLALAATVASHFMFASVLGIILAADPGYIFMWIGGAAIFFLCAAGDLFCFLDMLLGED
ncbi:unnamed protein product [Urochloa decumbens]|uniref:Uncharacterized protein n=1 Tax=Urochloa decumbens TaxID=240449 RepID=A0ABC8YZX2_9POAL